MTALDVLPGDAPLDRDDWLAWRREGVGASDVAAILGISPWASPWSVWADKVGLVPPEPESEVMEAGRWLEAAIGPWFEHRTGLVVAGEQRRVTSPVWEVGRCTVDGFVLDPGQATPPTDGFEVKITGPGRRWDELPPYYEAQGQWQMWVAELERVHFAVLHGRRLEHYVLDRDDDDIDVITDTVVGFWDRHVAGGEAPDVDGHDATLRALAALYPSHTPKLSKPIDDAAAAVELLRDAKARRKAAEADEAGASAVIRWAMGDAYEGTVAGERALTLGTSTRKTTCQHCGAEDESGPFRTLRLAKESKP